MKPLIFLFSILILIPFISASEFGIGSRTDTFGINTYNITYITQNISAGVSGAATWIAFFDSVTSIIGSAKLTWNDTTGQLTLNRNTAPTPAATINGTAFRVNCANSEACRMGITSYNQSSGYSVRAAQSNGTTPTENRAGDTIGSFDAYTRVSTTAWSPSPRGAIAFISSEAQTTTNQGVDLELWATPTGTKVPKKIVETNGLNFNVTGNINITGNFSARRPYLNAHDETTQNFLNSANVQEVNISTIDDRYLINIVNKTNLTFEMTGDYIITFMPLLYTTTGSNKKIAFWIAKNGVDVNWTNTRISMPTSGIETAPSITYLIDIENPKTDVVTIKWWSDTTASQLLTITAGLTSPQRPAVPSVIVVVQKISELT